MHFCSARDIIVSSTWQMTTLIGISLYHQLGRWQHLLVYHCIINLADDNTYWYIIVSSTWQMTTLIGISLYHQLGRWQHLLVYHCIINLADDNTYWYIIVSSTWQMTTFMFIINRDFVSSHKQNNKILAKDNLNYTRNEQILSMLNCLVSCEYIFPFPIISSQCNDTGWWNSPTEERNYMKLMWYKFNNFIPKYCINVYKLSSSF